MSVVMIVDTVDMESPGDATKQKGQAGPFKAD